MNILLLQGPLGPFYQTLSQHLVAAGYRVIKVYFNGGDACWPCAGEPVHYRGTASEWSPFFEQLLQQYAVDTVLCYGDCRYYHRLAGQICQRKQLPFWVMEEGYLRPHFVTLEQGGANAFSPLYPQRAKLAQWQWPVAAPAPTKIGKTFAARAWFASRYHINKALAQWRYP
ncbi:capsule biosynthesis protein, partial [Aeromonas cavernicola]